MKQSPLMRGSERTLRLYNNVSNVNLHIHFVVHECLSIITLSPVLPRDVGRAD